MRDRIRQAYIGGAIRSRGNIRVISGSSRIFVRSTHAATQNGRYFWRNGGALLKDVSAAGGWGDSTNWVVGKAPGLLSRSPRPWAATAARHASGTRAGCRSERATRLAHGATTYTS